MAKTGNGTAVPKHRSQFGPFAGLPNLRPSPEPEPLRRGTGQELARVGLVESFSAMVRDNSPLQPALPILPFPLLEGYKWLQVQTRWIRPPFLIRYPPPTLYRRHTDAPPIRYLFSIQVLLPIIKRGGDSVPFAPPSVYRIPTVFEYPFESSVGTKSV